VPKLSSNRDGQVGITLRRWSQSKVAHRISVLRLIQSDGGKEIGAEVRGYGIATARTGTRARSTVKTHPLSGKVRA
jgi:hypothetical protein